jgi:hypothetical protein
VKNWFVDIVVVEEAVLVVVLFAIVARGVLHKTARKVQEWMKMKRMRMKRKKKRRES